MKILVFEYITGGGLVNQTLPDSLLREGEMMLLALVDDFLKVDNVELTISRDYRLPPISVEKYGRLTTVSIEADNQIDNILVDLIDQADAVLPIAPETDHILYNLCCLIESRNVQLLSSPSPLVKLASDKWASYQHLQSHDIPLVATRRLLDFDGSAEDSQTWLVKPFDGVGCEGVTRLRKEQIEKLVDPEKLIVQPFVEGRSLSLSALFTTGTAKLICINQQVIKQDQDRLVLQACQVNIQSDKLMYANLIEQIAQAIPGLWGYIGIDLIESPTGPLVLEINPRFTTSYTGINQALGLNIGASLLELLTQMPELSNTKDEQVLIKIEPS